MSHLQLSTAHTHRRIYMKHLNELAKNAISALGGRLQEPPGSHALNEANYMVDIGNFSDKRGTSEPSAKLDD